MTYYKIDIKFNDRDSLKTYTVIKYEVFPNLLKLYFRNGITYFNLNNIREFDVYEDEAKLIVK